MKKALSLLVLLALFNACDDGDLTQEDISFEDVTSTQSCSANSIIYKLKEKEREDQETERDGVYFF